MRTTWTVLFFVLGALAAPAARADEMVYFTNGTYMRVQSHEIQGETVRLRIDGSAMLAFPARMVERIEGTYGVVFEAGAARSQPNQALPGPARTTSDTAYPVGANPALISRGRPDAPQQRVDPTGRTGWAMSGRGADASFEDGSIMAARRSGPMGTTQLGNRLVVDPGNVPGQRSNFRPVPFQARPLRDQPPTSSPIVPEPGPGVQVLPPSQDEAPAAPDDDASTDGNPDPPEEP